MATEQDSNVKTVELQYGREGATPTPYSYLADGGLRKEDRDALAEKVGAKSSDGLDFRVVEDNIGHSMKVEVSPKAKEPAGK